MSVGHLESTLTQLRALSRVTGEPCAWLTKAEPELGVTWSLQEAWVLPSSCPMSGPVPPSLA